MTNLPIRLVGEGGNQVAAEFEQAARSGVVSLERVKRSAGEANAKLAEMGGGFSGLAGGKVQNAAFQISDFAVQVGNGTRVSTALSQQLPQLLAGFGPLGAVIGAVAAVALPLGAAFFGMGDEADGLTDHLDSLEDATARVDAAMAAAKGPEALIERYGRATEAVRGLVRAMAESALEAQRAEVDSLIRDTWAKFADTAEVLMPAAPLMDLRGMDAMAQSMERSTEGVEQLRAALKLTQPDAQALQALLTDARAQEEIGAQADALARIRDYLSGVTDEYGRMTPEARAMREEVIAAEDKLRQAEASAGRLETALSSASGTMSDLSAEATRAADEIARATTNAMTLKSQAQFDRAEAALRLLHKGDPVAEAGALAGLRFDRQVGDYSGLDSIIRDQIQRDREEIVRARQDAARDIKALQEWNAAQREAAGRGGGGGGGGGGGAKSELVRELEREREVRDRVIDGLRNEREMIGQSELAQRISNETRAAGVDLDSQYGQEIAALVTEIDGLTEAQERTAAVNEFLSESFGSLFEGAITGANSLKESVSQLALRLGDMALTRGFESLFSGFSFGGGGLGKFVSSVFGIGARASGGPVAAGMPYWVGEQGVELVVPRSSGSVVSNRDLAAALSGGGRQAPSGIEVTVNGARGNSEIQAMVAAGVVQALRAYDAGLPERIGQIGMDPRYRG